LSCLEDRELQQYGKPMIQSLNAPRILFLSTYPPEECGLATFTRDSADAVDLAAGKSVSSVLAIEKTRSLTGACGRVAHVIDNSQRGAYRKAAIVANQGPWDVISLQHEFGLYPGDWGEDILEFVRHCHKPLVSTFHTLPTQPTHKPRHVIQQIASRSNASIVMTEMAANLLHEVYGVPRKNVNVIPHGVPVLPFETTRKNRTAGAAPGRQVIGTFGLINPGKGLELMIRAMPEIVAEFPNTVYSIVGVTHPQVKRDTGEVYREQLAELAHSLGVGRSVEFVNRYLSLPELIEFLQSCDVFVTPYPGKDQIASGTMAYAMAAVGAVVSTPYLFAEEVLAEGRGQLVPFSSSLALAGAVQRFLRDPEFLEETRLRAYRYAQSMFWPNVGRRYLRVFAQSAAAEKTLAYTGDYSPTHIGEAALTHSFSRKI